MLIVYNKTTGKVVDNMGTNNMFPEGPPDEFAYFNTDAQNIKRTDLAILRLNDTQDHELVSQTFSNEYSVDVKRRSLVIGAPRVEAEETVQEDPVVDPMVALLARLDTLEAEIATFRSAAPAAE